MAAAHRSPVPDRLILLTTILFLPTIHHAHHYLHPMGALLLGGILQKKIDSNSWPRSVVTLFNLSVFKVGMNTYFGLGMLRLRWCFGYAYWCSNLCTKRNHIKVAYSQKRWPMSIFWLFKIETTFFFFDQFHPWFSKFKKYKSWKSGSVL